MMAFLCQSGFGQSVPAEKFRLDQKSQDHEIIQHEDIRISPYALDLTKDLAIFGVGNVMIGLGLLLSHDMDPLTAEEVATLDPMDVNKFDRATITTKREVPAGDLLLLGSIFLPLTFLAQEETKRDMGMLAVMAGEVFVFQLGLNFVAKGLADRVRPYCYDENTPLDLKKTVNARLSFYSGHTSTAAAMSFFVAKVFSDYLTNTTTKTIIWTSAVMYPALTGFLRIDSGNHFRTDVLVGYITGALVGYFVPILHKSKLKDNLSVQPSVSDNHVAIRLSYAF
jgi:membrane-associated phospholipid phosphatase